MALKGNYQTQLKHDWIPWSTLCLYSGGKCVTKQHRTPHSVADRLRINVTHKKQFFASQHPWHPAPWRFKAIFVRMRRLFETFHKYFRIIIIPWAVKHSVSSKSDVLLVRENRTDQYKPSYSIQTGRTRTIDAYTGHILYTLAWTFKIWNSSLLDGSPCILFFTSFLAFIHCLVSYFVTIQ